VALAVFAYTIIDPAANPIPFLAGFPPVVTGLVWALAAIIWVWFLEAVVALLRR
jgi:hypothetical protein